MFGLRELRTAGSACDPNGCDPNGWLSDCGEKEEEGWVIRMRDGDIRATVRASWTVRDVNDE